MNFFTDRPLSKANSGIEGRWAYDKSICFRNLPDGQEPRPETAEECDEERPKSVAPQQDDRVSKLQLELEAVRATKETLQDQVGDLLKQRYLERREWRDTKLALDNEVSVLKAENLALEHRLNEATADRLESTRSERRPCTSTVQVGETEKDTAQETIARLRRRLARREKQLWVREKEFSDVRTEMRFLQKGVKRLYEDSRSRPLWDDYSSPEDSEWSPEE